MGFISDAVSGVFGGGTKKATKKNIAMLEKGNVQNRGDIEEGYNRATGFLQPWATQGGAAFTQMGNMLGLNGGPAQNEGFNNYMSSTGYQFLLDSGSKAITGSAAAKGLTRSGSTMKALAGFGQNLAATKTAEYMQMLGSMSGVGASAAGGMANAASSAAGQKVASTNNMTGTVANNRMTNANNMADAWGSTFNAGMALAGMSERRVKTDIEKIGEFIDGLGVYIYRYIWGGPLQWGVMVDEVAELRPSALGPVVDGIQTVDYGRL